MTDSYILQLHISSQCQLLHYCLDDMAIFLYALLYDFSFP